MSEQYSKILPDTMEFARSQAKFARRYIQNTAISDLTVQKKTDQSLVSDIDRHVESEIRRAITERFPNHGILGEEFPQKNPQSRYQWIIDPIDGTQEFVNGSPLFGFLLSLNFDDEPILGIIDHPLLDIYLQADVLGSACYNGEPVNMLSSGGADKGIVLPAVADFLDCSNEHTVYEQLIQHYPNYRVFRSCYGHTSTILGHTSLSYEHNVSIWDINSTRIIIERAGGRFEILRKISLPNNEHRYCVVFGIASEVDRFVDVFQSIVD